MPPRQGPLSSQGFMDFGVRFGQYIFHRGPTDWVLDRMPDGAASPLRRLVAKSIREIGRRVLLPETTVQEAMNRKLFMNTVDAQTGEPLMAEAQEDFLYSLFPRGRQDEWPRQLVICTKDVRPDPAMLRQTMLHFPEIAGDALGKPLDVVDGFDQPVAGRVVILGSYNTEQDIFHNAGSVLERTQEIKRDPLSIEGMSEAAIKAGDTLLALMTLRHEFGETILRDDAPEVMRHVMAHGYSQGGNIATDIFRYIRSELMSGRYEIAQDATGEHTVSAASPEQVAALLGNAYCYTIAAADAPYRGGDFTTLPPRDNSRSDGELAPLRGHLAPRFLDSVMVVDIMFHDHNITLDFERGTNPRTLKPAIKAISKTLKASGIEVIAQNDPYRLCLHGQKDATTLGTIRNAMRKSGIEYSDNLNTVLSASNPRE